MFQRIFILITFFSLYLIVCLSVSYAQADCDVKVYTLDAIRGEIVSAGPKGYVHLPGSTVELRRISEDEDVLAFSTVSDAKGLFVIENIVKGSYRLVVRNSKRGFKKFEAGIRITKKTKSSTTAKKLWIRLGVSLSWEGCGDSKLVNK